MNADLERLIALQKLVSAAHDAERRLADEPEREKALDARLEAARQRVAAAKERLAENQNARRAVEKDVAVHQGRLSKFREQAMAVKTNQEYHAVQKEIGFAQGEIKTIEDKILELMVEADDLTATVKRAEAELASEQKAVDADRRAMTTELTAMKSSLERIAVERAEVVRGLNAQVLAIFELVLRRRNGVAVAQARDGICTVCHVRLRPQVFNTILRNDQIIQCDSCQRILYHVPAAAPAPSTPFLNPRSDHARATINAEHAGNTCSAISARSAFDVVSTASDAIVAYIDGGARGNPGPAGYGVRIEQPDGTLDRRIRRVDWDATNNVAEYRGLIAALEWARRHGHNRLHVRSDSLLLVQQMLGRFKVKHPGLQPLYAKARLLAHEIGRVTFEHVGRAHNEDADRLANAAMDDAAGTTKS